MKNFIALIIATTSLLTISCSNDDSKDNVDPIIGRWYYVSTIYNERFAVAKEASSRTAAADKYVKFIEFKSDGTFLQGFQNGTTTTDNVVNTYTKVENTINVKNSSKEGTYSLTVSKVNANELIIIYDKNSGKEGDQETYSKNIDNAANLD